MGRHQLALLALTLPSTSVASVAKAPLVVPVPGELLYEACGPTRSDDYCAGVIDAARSENGDRFLRRNCPPALVAGEHSYVDQVRAYLASHRPQAARPARDIVFDAETESLSIVLGQKCYER